MDSGNSPNFRKEFKKIRRISSIVEKKLSQFDNKDERKIEKLTYEELQDLNKLTSVADYILTKYEDNREVYLLLKDFVDMINNSSASMDVLNDRISELVISAGSAVSKIKNLQGDVSENYSLMKTGSEKQENEALITPESSTNNLTKSATAVYT
jgi:Sec-independent protein translocase protein TatA